MSKKTTTSFNIDQAVSRISRPSVFDRIVKEIDPKEIPAKYIEQILVQYHDGAVVELKGKDITDPIPMNRNRTWDTILNSQKLMKDVRIFINTERLEKDINDLVEGLLGNYC
jgi:hypothetical protein